MNEMVDLQRDLYVNEFTLYVFFAFLFLSGIDALRSMLGVSPVYS